MILEIKRGRPTDPVCIAERQRWEDDGLGAPKIISRTGGVSLHAFGHGKTTSLTIVWKRTMELRLIVQVDFRDRTKDGRMVMLGGERTSPSLAVRNTRAGHDRLVVRHSQLFDIVLAKVQRPSAGRLQPTKC